MKERKNRSRSGQWQQKSQIRVFWTEHGTGRRAEGLGVSHTRVWLLWTMESAVDIEWDLPSVSVSSVSS